MINNAEKKLYKLLSDILKIKPDKISDQTSAENTPSWDSFNGLMIASELEKQFKVVFTMDEVIDVKNVGDIKKQLKNHGVKF